MAGREIGARCYPRRWVGGRRIWSQPTIIDCADEQSPITSVLAYRHTGGHWHLVTHGLRDLMHGFELSIRVSGHGGQLPEWSLDLLKKLAQTAPCSHRSHRLSRERNRARGERASGLRPGRRSRRRQGLVLASHWPENPTASQVRFCPTWVSRPPSAGKPTGWSLPGDSRSRQDCHFPNENIAG